MSKQLTSLDGLRGLAALWVLVGHTLNLTGVSVPLMSSPKLGVDLFIMLSGFLMVYTAEAGLLKPGGVGRFLIRRLFRIAPIFYITLIISLLFGSVLGDMRASLPGVVDTVRYADQSWLNFFFHVTFIFGLLPEYAFRTPLPDWSIGLEIQFYILFPIIALISSKRGPIVAAFIMLLISSAAWILLPNYMSSFPQPSLVFLKINLFLSGIFIAKALSSRRLVYLALAVSMAALPLDGDWGALKSTVPVLLAIALILAVHSDRLSLLGVPVLRWMGDISYSVYLIHFPVLIVVAWCFREIDHPVFHAMITLLFLIPVVFLMSHIAFMLIEQPAIRWAKALTASARLKGVEPRSRAMS